MSADPIAPARDELADPAYQADLKQLADAVLKKHRGDLDVCYLARQTLALLERIKVNETNEHRPQPRGRKEK